MGRTWLPVLTRQQWTPTGCMCLTAPVGAHQGSEVFPKPPCTALYTVKTLHMHWINCPACSCRLVLRPDRSKSASGAHVGVSRYVLPWRDHWQKAWPWPRWGICCIRSCAVERVLQALMKVWTNIPAWVLDIFDLMKQEQDEQPSECLHVKVEKRHGYPAFGVARNDENVQLKSIYSQWINGSGCFWVHWCSFSSLSDVCSSSIFVPEQPRDVVMGNDCAGDAWP